MDQQPPRQPYPDGDGPRDPDRTTGPDQAGRAAGPTAGRAARHEDVALGLGGTESSEPGTGMLDAAADESPNRAEGGSGLEHGNASLGSNANAATRVDSFNVPTSEDREPR